jgi:hypothetical protein
VQRLLACMQDQPKALPADARVGFTVINQVHTGSGRWGGGGQGKLRGPE